MTSYRTVAREGADEFIEKRSRFLGHARPVQTPEEALAYIESLRSRYWDASHNVWAYSLREGQQRRCSDDGEPHGTGGMPALEVLTRGDIVDTVVVITRWFGGTLLGAGGLTRAYSRGAKIAVDAAGAVMMRLCREMSLTCDYSLWGSVQYLLGELGLGQGEAAYTDIVTLSLAVPDERCAELEKKLADLSAGKLRPVFGAELFLPAADDADRDG